MVRIFPLFLCCVLQSYHVFCIKSSNHSCRPVGVKRRRLVSNVKLYHPDHYDPEIDLSSADEIVSDHEDGDSDSLSAVDDDFEELTDCYS